MQIDPWRVVLVRAWRHGGDVAAVLFVAEPGSAITTRHAAAGSVDEACRVLGAVLGELTPGTVPETTAQTETTTGD